MALFKSIQVTNKAPIPSVDAATDLVCHLRRLHAGGHRGVQ
jgi:hypothetical protein